MNKNLRRMLIPKSILTEDYDIDEIIADLRNGKDSGVSENTYWELNGEKSPKEVAEFVAEGELGGDDWELILDEDGVLQFDDIYKLEPERAALALYLANEDEDEAFEIYQDLKEEVREGKGKEFEGYDEDYTIHWVVYSNWDDVNSDAREIIEKRLADDYRYFREEDLAEHLDCESIRERIRKEIEDEISQYDDDELVELMIDNGYDGYEEFVADNEDDEDNYELTDRDGLIEDYVDYRMDNDYYNDRCVINWVQRVYGKIFYFLQEHPYYLDVDSFVESELMYLGADYFISSDNEERLQEYNGIEYIIYEVG